MRLFIGIDFPQDFKEQICQELNVLKKSEKGWERAHDYHQTLLFIGEVDHSQIEVIKSRLDEISFRPFNLTSGSIEFFSRRIMFLSFKPSLELIELKNIIERKFPEWTKADSKPFVPHVTVKRWQRYEYEDLKNGLSRMHLKPLTITVSGLSLFKSEKDTEGNKYHVIYQTLNPLR